MRANMKAMLKVAAENKKIVPGFNVFGYEDAKMVIEVAEELNAPALLMTNRDAANFMDLKYYGALYGAMADDASVEVCYHLDHGKSVNEVVKAIQAGYTSVMYDGSAYTIEENVSVSKQISEMCQECGISFEVEVGCVAYNEPHMTVKERLTEVEDVLMMVNEVAVDGLAVAVGNVHRMTEPEAVIDFDRLEKVQKCCDVPLVIHGSSGIPTDQIIKMREYGIGKMNVGTAVRQAFGNTLREFTHDNPEVFDRIELMKEPMEAMKKAIRARYEMLGW